MERAKAHLSRGLRVEDQKYFEGSDADHRRSVRSARRAPSSPPAASRAASTSTASRRRSWRSKDARPATGRFLGESDVESKKPVCILGFKLKEQLFGGDDAVGQQVSVGGRRLTVIGVGTKFNMQFVNDDDMRKETGGVYIPFSVYQDMFGRANAISYMLAKADDPEKSHRCRG